MKRPVGNIETDKRQINLGAPRKLKKRNERQIMRSINELMKDIGTFSSMKLQNHAGLTRARTYAVFFLVNGQATIRRSSHTRGQATCKVKPL